MPKLLSRSKHEKFESNSALQIRDQKERRAENARKLKLPFWQAAKISQPTNFRRLRNYNMLTMFTSPLFILQPLFSSISRICCFCYNFLFLPILTLVIAFVLVCFVISLTLSTYISLSLYKLCINQLTSLHFGNTVSGRQFRRYFLLFPFSFLFLGCQTLL